uniref:NACHT domain-containing protein n=1 Tax=Plectus sambesii TaxID=2011161 RepID=A0A914V0S7_9BILA
MGNACCKEESPVRQTTSIPSQHDGVTYNNHNNKGRLVGAPITGGTINQGDTHNNSQHTSNNFKSFNNGAGMNLSGYVTGERPTIIQNYNNYGSGQASTNSSPTSSQPITEDRQQLLESVQQSLNESYLTRFQKVYPFSLPFTFDIENTWVSLALKDERYSQATENHAELLKKAFDKVKMLIIEGDPATGKTSLMRRLAYEWANGKQELLHYDLVLYAEFRE